MQIVNTCREVEKFYMESLMFFKKNGENYDLAVIGVCLSIYLFEKKLKNPFFDFIRSIDLKKSLDDNLKDLWYSCIPKIFIKDSLSIKNYEEIAEMFFSQEWLN